MYCIFVYFVLMLDKTGHQELVAQDVAHQQDKLALLLATKNKAYNYMFTSE
jgi:hypothetical protein